MNNTPSAPQQGQYAGFITRLIAFVIDIVIVNFMVLVFAGVGTLLFGFFSNLSIFLGIRQSSIDSPGAILIQSVAVVMAFALAWLYPIVFWTISGQTIGKTIMGLRVVRMDGKRMTFWRGFVRVFGYILSAIPFFLGFIWVLFSNERRGWHDKIAGTCVIYSWEARDSKTMLARMSDTTNKLSRNKS